MSSYAATGYAVGGVDLNRVLNKVFVTGPE